MGRKWSRRYTRTIRLRPQGPVTGVVVQFERIRTWIESAKLFEGHDFVGRKGLAERTEGEIAFTITWDEPREFSGDERIQVRGRFRGAPPSEVRVAWLAEGGRTVSEQRPVVPTEAGIEGAFDPDEAEKLIAILAPDLRHQLSERLRQIVLCNEPELREGAAFFHDLDLATHPELKEETLRSAVTRLREELFDRVLERGRVPEGELPDFSAGRTRKLVSKLEEYRQLFRRLLLVHFVVQNELFAYDGSKFGRAVRDFVLGRHPRHRLAGIPDSPYYFCFAELIALFAEREGEAESASERSFWLPALEAFVVTQPAFVRLYRKKDETRMESYTGAQGLLSFGLQDRMRDVEEALDLRLLQLQELEQTSDERWKQLLLDMAATVRSALREELELGDEED